MTSPRLWLAPTLGFIVLGLAAAADARPGGGQSYSGSSSRSSSSSSSRSSSSSSSRSSSRSGSSGVRTDDTTSLILFAVCSAIIVPWQLNATARDKRQSFDSGGGSRPRSRRPAQLYKKLRDLDPEFSAVLFEDFVFALYARVQAARESPTAMDALAPYVSEASRAALLRRQPRGKKIHGVVIGSMQVDAVSIGESVDVDLSFEANFTADLPDGPQGHYVRERWTMTRPLDMEGSSPTAVQSFRCPSCGAGYDRSDVDECASCGRPIAGAAPVAAESSEQPTPASEPVTADPLVQAHGRGWTLRHVRQLEQETRPPALTGHVEEVGTELPTEYAPDVAAEARALERDDPEATWHNIDARFRTIYERLNTAWTARDLRKIRPHVSDAMYNYLAYWIDAYRDQDLHNVLKDMSVSQAQLVKVVRDRYYDAVTLRFYASGFDYTLDASGKRVSGSEHWQRRYSEYWTLIRGAAVRGAPRDPASCPGCGAPLDRVNMAGNCEYCGAHMTRGEFDWVLSKIEQDEAYTG